VYFDVFEKNDKVESGDEVVGGSFHSFFWV